MLIRVLVVTMFAALTAFSQVPAIEPGVSHELAKWRAVNYANISYKLNLTLEKMSPVLKGTMEIRVSVSSPHVSEGSMPQSSTPTEVVRPQIILDWRKLPGHERDSSISNVSLNGVAAVPDHEGIAPISEIQYQELSEHLFFGAGVVAGENVIKLDFTSPILTSGSAITRYIDKEDGSEYIYSLFVPSDASTAFPVFDQPDLKARFTLNVQYPKGWLVVSDTRGPWELRPVNGTAPSYADTTIYSKSFPETKPISTYLFAFAAGPFANFREDTKGFLVTSENLPDDPAKRKAYLDSLEIPPGENPMFIYVRRSQAVKFQQHAAETFRLTRAAINYLETYFDYKFPWPKYDLVLIPEFPFGGMEHAGATFLRESGVIFPSEPTKGDYISRANLIFHETAHQWFGDTVTMTWFDDLWLKEGFAEFMAYKTLEHVMPEANAWKVFYERNKQAAYATDSNRGTTPIYQPIDNLSSAKSAYGNIVYRKAPSFLRQAEFYLGEDKFQTAVRAFLKKHEFGNATWEDLVSEFEAASGQDLKLWAQVWVQQRGVTTYRIEGHPSAEPPTWYAFTLSRKNGLGIREIPDQKVMSLYSGKDGRTNLPLILTDKPELTGGLNTFRFFFPNYGDYGYGIFLLDDKSRDYVLKNIQNEKDDFLRSMMWGSLWDSVREAELNPKDYVELVIKNINVEKDEGTIQSLLGRVSTAMNYYLPAEHDALTGVRASATSDLRSRFEAVLLDRMQHAATPGQRITFFRAFVANASTEHGRAVLKAMLASTSRKVDPSFVCPPDSQCDPLGPTSAEIELMPSMSAKTGKIISHTIPTLRTKDRFDIVTRLAILGDPEAPKLLADLEKTETSDDAKRYVYAAHAAFGTAGNKAKYWNDFLTNKDISESWIEAAMVPFNSIRHADLTQPYLTRALAELPNLKRSRKIFFVNGWLSAFIGGQRSEAALAIVNKFLADNPNLDKDLRLKILENADLIERAVNIRAKYGKN